MKEKVSVAQAAITQGELPPRVQEALGELVGVAKDGLLALSVGVGLGVLTELMEEEVDEVVGPKGKHDPDRAAVRHGHDAGEVTLGAVASGSSAGGHAPPTASPRWSYAHFADRDPLTRVVLEQMLAGVSTRRCQRTREPVAARLRSGRVDFEVGRVAGVRRQDAREPQALMVRRLDDVRLAVMMIDGIDLKGRTNVVALGITTEGVKIPLGLWEGSTENATVATALLSDLVDRGLDPEQGILFAIDGAKALRKAIRAVFGDQAPVQRCVRHKERNVLEHLAQRDRPALKRRLRRAWKLDDHDRALADLQLLASELDRSHPGAASSLREGMAETLTLTRLGIKGKLKQTLESTNPCESMIECVRRSSRNVKHWQSGDMALRWTAAGMLEAERQFRRIIGYKDLANLVIAIERDLPTTPTDPTREEAATLATA